MEAHTLRIPELGRWRLEKTEIQSQSWLQSGVQCQPGVHKLLSAKKRGREREGRRERDIQRERDTEGFMVKRFGHKAATTLSGGKRNSGSHSAILQTAWVFGKLNEYNVIFYHQHQSLVSLGSFPFSSWPVTLATL